MKIKDIIWEINYRTGIPEMLMSTVFWTIVTGLTIMTYSAVASLSYGYMGGENRLEYVECVKINPNTPYTCRHETNYDPDLTVIKALIWPVSLPVQIAIRNPIYIITVVGSIVGLTALGWGGSKSKQALNRRQQRKLEEARRREHEAQQLIAREDPDYWRQS